MVRHLSLWAACLVLSVAFVFGVYLVQAYVIKAQKQSLMKTKEIQGRLTAKIELQKRLQGDQDKLSQQRSALYAIKSKSLSASQVIAKLSEIMNEQTWLSQLSLEATEEREKETNLLLTGFSTSNEHLGDFLKRLSAERAFKGVVLKFASESDVTPGQKIPTGKIKFQIACQLSRG